MRLRRTVVKIYNVSQAEQGVHEQSDYPHLPKMHTHHACRIGSRCSSSVISVHISISRGSRAAERNEEPCNLFGEHKTCKLAAYILNAQLIQYYYSAMIALVRQEY